MLIHLKGSNKSVRKLVKIAVWYYAEKLMGKRLMANLVIDVILEKGMIAKNNNEATAIWEDDDARSHRGFTIKIDPKPTIRNILISLAHEMVHVKQWARNEMKEYCRLGEVRYMNKKYNMENIDYWDYPWEIEAFGRQLGLFVRFCEENGFAKRKDMKEEA